MTQYNADAIEVLTGLEPVRKRPGMYTDTARPNHLAQEVIDNSVDEPWRATRIRLMLLCMPMVRLPLPIMVGVCRLIYTRSKRSPA